LNVPPAVPSLQDTVPVGVVGEVELSTIEAVNVSDPIGDTVAWLGVRVRVVECNVLVDKVELVEVGTVEVFVDVALDDDELFALDVDDVNIVEDPKSVF